MTCRQKSSYKFAVRGAIVGELKRTRPCETVSQLVMFDVVVVFVQDLNPLRRCRGLEQELVEMGFSVHVGGASLLVQQGRPKVPVAGCGSSCSCPLTVALLGLCMNHPDRLG